MIIKIGSFLYASANLPLFTGDIARFKEHTFCSFEYLLAMADADHIQKVFNNLEIIRTLLVDSDIHLLNLTIQSSGVGLHSSPLQLANEIIGRMRQIKGEQQLVYFLFIPQSKLICVCKIPPVKA